MSVAMGNRPAAGRAALGEVDREVDEGGHADAAHGRKHGEHGLAGAPQLAHRGLVLELDAHEQEEDRHEEVVHELLHGERDREAAHAHHERQLEQVLDALVERRVGNDEGEDGSRHHHRRGNGAVARHGRERGPALQAPDDRGLLEDGPGARHAHIPLSPRSSVCSTATFAASASIAAWSTRASSGAAGSPERSRSSSTGNGCRGEVLLGVPALGVVILGGLAVPLPRRVREARGQGALQRLAGAVVEGLEVELRGPDHGGERGDLRDGEDALERAHEEQGRDVPAGVALLVRRRNHALLDVVVHHRPRDEGLAGDLHELELLRDQREELVQVELYAGISRMRERCTERMRSASSRRWPSVTRTGASALFFSATPPTSVVSPETDYLVFKTM